jgi:hypothetical protein
LGERGHLHKDEREPLRRNVDPLKSYTSLRPECKKLTLTPAIFKEIEKYDFSVEMLEQEISHPKWVIHIFDKESKIEVARYE